MIKRTWLLKENKKVLSHDTYHGIRIHSINENSKEVWDVITFQCEQNNARLKHHLIEYRQVNFDKYTEKYKDVYPFYSSDPLIQEIPYCDEEVWVIMYLEER